MPTFDWLVVESRSISAADVARLEPMVQVSAELLEAWMERHGVLRPEQVEVVLRPSQKHVPLGRCQTYNRGTSFTLYLAADRPDLEVEMLGHEFAHVALLRALDTVDALPDDVGRRDLLLHVVSEFVATLMMPLFAPDATQAAVHVQGSARWWQRHFARRSRIGWRKLQAAAATDPEALSNPLARLIGGFAYTAAAFAGAGRDSGDLAMRSGLPGYALQIMDPLLAPLRERSDQLPADPGPNQLGRWSDGYLDAAMAVMPRTTSELAAALAARRLGEKQDF